jgi:general secretion pathway protein E/type IV pilus assembly protein PilB
MRILQRLLQRGLIDQGQLERLLEEAGASELRLDRLVVELGYVSESQMLEVLGAEQGTPMVDLSSVAVDRAVLARVPEKLIHRTRIMPLYQENGALVVATSDPLDVFKLDEFAVLSGREIKPVLATSEQIERLIRRYLGIGSETVQRMVGEEDQRAARGAANGANGEGRRKRTNGSPLSGSTVVVSEEEESSLIALVNEFLLEAIRARASDIHIEPFEDDLRIRYRIDGVLQDASVPREMKRFQAAIISRIKIMANLNIAEKRLPQDGRIRLNVSGHELDLRVSIIPMLHGEGTVLRVLDRSAVQLLMPELGMNDAALRRFRELVTMPHGVLLVTGPTGSGKTTTLYAALNELNDNQRKIVTIEDPIEYELRGTNQIQVHPQIGLSFAHGLRSVLRHDPDIIMVGEIRDGETAEIAVQAALTGHLVLSTLHTNDAPSAVTRLVDMGMEPYLVASCVEGVLAQRLVRVNCPKCKRPGPVDREQLGGGRIPTRIGTVQHGTGCEHCRGTGYAGRTGIFELMPASNALRELIMARADASRIRTQAVAGGMTALQVDGWAKVEAGLTTPEEVLRLTKDVESDA